MVQSMNSYTDIISILLTPVTAISAAGLVATCLSVIFRMTAETNHWVRMVYTTIATGAFGEMFGVMVGRIPSTFESILVIGVGALFVFDRRSCTKARTPTCECQRNREASK